MAFSIQKTVLLAVIGRGTTCRRAAENEKGGSRSFQNGFRLDYFQSLKISSNAISKAVFILFSIKLKISVLAPGENRHFEPGENSQFQPGRNRQSVPGGCSQPRFGYRF